MKILGFDSSGLVASVAIVQDDNLIAEYTINHKKTHSQTLLPMLDEIIKMTETDKGSFDAIAVAAGPGSFTGLRIGSATAKGLALALDIPIVAVPTLEGLAYNLWGWQGLICPIMDARRNQVYTALYRFDVSGAIETVMEQIPLDIEELIDRLNKYDDEVIFVGDGITQFAEKIKEKMIGRYSFAPAHMNKQRAGSIAVSGINRYREGLYEQGDEHSPIYLRVSQAEREREERMNSKGRE